MKVLKYEIKEFLKFEKSMDQNYTSVKYLREILPFNDINATDDQILKCLNGLCSDGFIRKTSNYNIFVL